jgi:hypothetical protein
MPRIHRKRKLKYYKNPLKSKKGFERSYGYKPKKYPMRYNDGSMYRKGVETFDDGLTRTADDPTKGDYYDTFEGIDWQKLFAETSREHTKLIKWLYDNHKDVLREYEKSTGSKMRVMFT